MADEQPKKKRTEFDRSYDKAKSLKGEIASWVIRHFARHGATFEKLLDWRQERIYDSKAWKTMQQWARTSVNDYFDFVFAQVDQLLISTSVFQGKRRMHGDPALNEARLVYEEEKALEAEGKATGCWCYAFCDTRNGNRLILVPYRAEDRAKELESGRLTQADLDDLWKREVIQLTRGNVLNGKPCLTMAVQVIVKDDGTLDMPAEGTWNNLF